MSALYTVTDTLECWTPIFQKFHISDSLLYLTAN